MEEDSRREAAIASLASKFNPSSSSAASQARLSKFQELHKRRLQIKQKSNTKNKSKGSFKTCAGSKLQEDETIILHKTTQDNGNSITLDGHHENVEAVAQLASKKPHKLHWGLDTKERWERKSNM
ncbi:uncharacterized protein LOC143564709 [Bidens hawaiensis]|uniref:uncharacterized protein LOC143564709 n=1 Tax=Bidens hawaiensis TaxID=980011 RepID=UPI00404B435B